MKTNALALKNYLYAQLERLDDETITGDELTSVIERGKAIADIAAQIIANDSLQLKAIKTAADMGINVEQSVLPKLLGIEKRTT